MICDGVGRKQGWAETDIGCDELHRWSLLREERYSRSREVVAATVHNMELERVLVQAHTSEVLARNNRQGAARCWFTARWCRLRRRFATSWCWLWRWFTTSWLRFLKDFFKNPPAFASGVRVETKQKDMAATTNRFLRILILSRNKTWMIRLPTFRKC